MHIKKKKATIALVVFAVLLLCVPIFMNTPLYHEWRIQNVKRAFIELYARDKSEIEDLATVICEEAAISGAYLHYNQYRNNFPLQLEHKLSAYLNSCTLSIDNVYVEYAGVFYPQGACIFQYTIENAKGVYAWVGLVYVPSTVQCRSDWYLDLSKGTEQINSEWYVTILYGY